MDSTALALTLAALGVLLIALSYQRHLHRRTAAALAHGIAGAILFLGGAVLLTLALNFNTYDPLRADQPLAELSIEQSGPQTFQVRLMRIPAGDLQVFTLKGDHWQLSAQLLEWHGWAQWLGLAANVRLEQLASTFDTPPTKNGKAVSTGSNSYGLSRNPGISLWDLQHQYPERVRALSTQALQTAAFPLQNSVRFHIYLSNGVLTARPINRPQSVKRLNAPTINYQGTPGPGRSSTSNSSIDSEDEAADLNIEAEAEPAPATE